MTTTGWLSLVSYIVNILPHLISRNHLDPLLKGYSSCADPEGGGGGGGGGGGAGLSGRPLENYEKIGFLSNTAPDPLKITNHSIQCWVIISSSAAKI